MMQQYLISSEYIDWQHPAILEKAESIPSGTTDSIEIAKACFVWVRDNIRHSHDYQDNTITCRASEVLLEGTGYCYAKSHLLAALLRANRIPAGLCYQRLSRDDNGSPFCLHGLNAIFLPEFGWYRIDPRGNKSGVNAEFCPPTEQLAFAIKFHGEADLPEIWVEPLQLVTEVLRTNAGYKEVWENLPDIPLINESIL